MGAGRAARLAEDRECLYNGCRTSLARDRTVRISLVIPALNEADVIGPLLSRIPPGVVDEVVVVDNGSTDDTAGAAVRLGARVVTEPRRGYGAACWAGVGACSPAAEVVVFLDGDGSQRPEELPSVL